MEVDGEATAVGVETEGVGVGVETAEVGVETVAAEVVEMVAAECTSVGIGYPSLFVSWFSADWTFTPLSLLFMDFHTSNCTFSCYLFLSC